MLEELEIHNLGPIRSALIAPAGGMTAITGETGAGKSMLLSAIRLISGGPSDGGRVSVGANEAWAQGVFEVASSPAAVAAAHEAGFEPEDGELFLSRKVPASGRSRSMLSGRSVPRSVLGSIAADPTIRRGILKDINGECGTGANNQWASEQGVGGQRHQLQRLHVRPHDRSSGGERVCG